MIINNSIKLNYYFCFLKLIFRMIKQDDFQSPDYYQLDALLTEQHLLIRQTIRDFVKTLLVMLVLDFYKTKILME